MAFSDINVPVSVKVESAELRRLITEFDGTTESAKALEAQTLKVKTAVETQSNAIRVLNQSNRVQNFELLQSLRILRTFASTAQNINALLQTSILKGIENNQTTIAQREAYKDLISTLTDLVHATEIFGSANLNVQGGWKEFITNAENLPSDKLEETIQFLERLAKSGKLSGTDLAFVTEKIKLLKEILAETKLKESQKDFENLFTTLFSAGASAAQIGLLVTQLQAQFNILSKIKGLGSLSNIVSSGGIVTTPASSKPGFIGPVKPTGGSTTVGGGAPGADFGGLGLIGGTAIGVQIMEFLLEQIGIQKQSGTAPKTSFKTLDDLTKILTNQTNNVNITMYGTKLNTEADMEKFAKMVNDLQRQGHTINSLVVN